MNKMLQNLHHHTASPVERTFKKAAEVSVMRTEHCQKKVRKSCEQKIQSSAPTIFSREIAPQGSISITARGRLIKNSEDFDLLVVSLLNILNDKKKSK
nr:PREDICTED: uncharacterized protein LOC109030525 isoform X2 [Bemisia tabaci]